MATQPLISTASSGPELTNSPALLLSQLARLDQRIMDATNNGQRLDDQERQNLAHVVEAAMAKRFVVAEGDDPLAAQLNAAPQAHHGRAVGLARALAVHDGSTNANPFQHDQLKRAYDSEFRFNQRFLAAQDLEPAPAAAPTSAGQARESQSAAQPEDDTSSIPAERSRAFLEARDAEGQAWAARADDELKNAFAHEAALAKYAEAAVPDSTVRERFMHVQRERIAKHLATGAPLPEVRIKEAPSQLAHHLDEVEQD